MYQTAKHLTIMVIQLIMVTPNESPIDSPRGFGLLDHAESHIPSGRDGSIVTVDYFQMESGKDALL
jgi:hypothetical protein